MSGRSAPGAVVGGHAADAEALAAGSFTRAPRSGCGSAAAGPRQAAFVEAEAMLVELAGSLDGHASLGPCGIGRRWPTTRRRGGRAPPPVRSVVSGGSAVGRPGRRAGGDGPSRRLDRGHGPGPVGEGAVPSGLGRRPGTARPGPRRGRAGADHDPASPRRPGADGRAGPGGAAGGSSAAAVGGGAPRRWRRHVRSAARARRRHGDQPGEALRLLPFAEIERAIHEARIACG